MYATSMYHYIYQKSSMLIVTYVRILKVKVTVSIATVQNFDGEKY